VSALAEIISDRVGVRVDYDNVGQVFNATMQTISLASIYCCSNLAGNDGLACQPAHRAVRESSYLVLRIADEDLALADATQDEPEGVTISRCSWTSSTKLSISSNDASVRSSRSTRRAPGRA
jgi:hypothetical protein